jgi:hypothetical protein
MTPFHPSVCPSQRATWQPYTPTACRRRGWPSAYRRLCRGQRYAEGLLRGLSRRPPTPTATTFGRRRSAQPSASSSIPVVGNQIGPRQCLQEGDGTHRPHVHVISSSPHIDPTIHKNDANQSYWLGIQPTRGHLTTTMAGVVAHLRQHPW